MTTTCLPVAVAAAYLLVALILAARDLRDSRRNALVRRLETLLDADETPLEVTKDRRLSRLPWLKSALLGRRWLAGLERRHARSGVRAPLAVFLLLAALLILTAWLLVEPWLGPVAALPAVAVGGLPFVWLRQAEKRRMARFEQQLPDALDLTARCLKAGHTLLGGIRAVAEEMDDPLGGEFRVIVDEVNYGKSIREALFNLTTRIESADLRFLIVAANIQSDSGGNLGEILAKLSDLIRARFTFRRTVRMLTAQGRCSARILTALPFAVILGFGYVNPELMEIMLHDPTGKIISLVTALLMAVGVFTIRRMVAMKA